MNKRNLRIPRVPLEWYAGSACQRLDNVWRLPSGKALAEFALQAGFVAPLLFKTEGFRANKESKRPGSGALEGSKQETKAARQ